VLKLAPDTVTFRFSETVTGTASAVRVYGPRGARVDQGGAFHPAGKSNAYAVKLQRRLTDGTYTATYQAVSADGHVISAGSTFSIGAPSSGTEAVSDLLASQKAGPITRRANDRPRRAVRGYRAGGRNADLLAAALASRACARERG
jgi:hypothetical protein